MHKPKYDWKLFACLAIGVIVLQAIYLLAVLSNIDSWNSRGLFGDAFGGLTALFSGLAFAGMVSALVLQTKELGLQREELILTRKAQEGAAVSQSDLVEKQLLTAQIQGIGFILDSYMQAAGSATSGNAKLAFSGKASKYNKLLSKLLEESGLDMPEK